MKVGIKMLKRKGTRKILIAGLLFLIIFILMGTTVFSEETNELKFSFPIPGDVNDIENNKETAQSIQVLLILTVIALAPSILIMMTSFTRIIIVLSFLRNAMGTQQMPPNQVLIGLALFLTLFIMSPVLSDLNDNAFKPFVEKEITYEVAADKAETTIKTFMINQMKSEEELAFFTNLAKIEGEVNPYTLPLKVVIPSFLIHELSIAFKMGFLIFIPFLIVDMVVASTLMSMGMMMLPPIMISLPFKILLFILINGWTLVTQTLVTSFNIPGG
jgi:flagellar biosynthetic protein FliP